MSLRPFPHLCPRAIRLAIAGLLFAANALAAAEQAVEIEPSRIELDSAETVPGISWCAERPQDEMWMISTRHLGCPQCGRDVPLSVRRWNAGIWQAADLPELTSVADPANTITLIYVHGNRIESNEVVGRGRTVYQRLISFAPAETNIRFVIWSWPSDQVKGQLRDFREKAVRTNNEGYFLGWLLAQMSPDARVGLMGYSYGARIATGALHVLGGGRLAGCALDAAPTHLPIRVTLNAAAVDRCWLLPSSTHGLALDQVDRMLVLYNNCDPALKHYGVVVKGAHPEALGYQGIATSCLGANGAKLDQVNMCCVVGKSHAEARYYWSSAQVARMAENLFGE